MDPEIVERTRRSFQAATEHMPTVIDKIRYRRKPIDLRGCYRTLAGDHRAVGIYDYFIDRNLRSFKQNLYVASQLELAAIALDAYQTFEVGREIFYALFSDNTEIISVMAHMETPELLKDRDNPLRLRFHVHMWQLSILGDYEALQTKVDKLARNGRKGERELAAVGKDFFSLLMRGDKQGLEDLINQHASLKSADPLIENFMSFQGCLEAKVSWLRGIPVQIDSPLVPMELMPVGPLDHYDDVYDFLNPGWEPLQEGLLTRVSMWMRNR